MLSLRSFMEQKSLKPGSPRQKKVFLSFGDREGWLTRAPFPYFDCLWFEEFPQEKKTFFSISRLPAGIFSGWKSKFKTGTLSFPPPAHIYIRVCCGHVNRLGNIHSIHITEVKQKEIGCVGGGSRSEFMKPKCLCTLLDTYTTMLTQTAPPTTTATTPTKTTTTHTALGPGECWAAYTYPKNMFALSARKNWCLL